MPLRVAQKLYVAARQGEVRKGLAKVIQLAHEPLDRRHVLLKDNEQIVSVVVSS